MGNGHLESAHLRQGQIVGKNPALRQRITLVAEITNTPSVIDKQKPAAATDSTLHGCSELSCLIVNWR